MGETPAAAATSRMVTRWEVPRRRFSIAIMSNYLRQKEVDLAK
jgi:hypothetical protein